MKLTKQKLHITGMHCSGCVERVTRVLNQLDGVRSAEVSLEDEQAVVDFNADQTGFTDLKQAIETAGYQVKTK